MKAELLCLVVFLSEKLGSRWQMEDLQSISLPWEIISEGAHPQQDWGCKVVLLHVTASLVGKQRGLKPKRFGFS